MYLFIHVKPWHSHKYHSAYETILKSLQWPHNGHDSVANHQPHDCLLNRLFRRSSKKISKLRVTGLCAGNSPETGEFPAQMASDAENVSIWWRHHEHVEKSTRTDSTKQSKARHWKSSLDDADFILPNQVSCWWYRNLSKQRVVLPVTKKLALSQLSVSSRVVGFLLEM